MAVALACDGSPVEIEPRFVVVRDVVVTHGGLELRFLKYNTSWYPRDDSPPPGPGGTFMTFRLEMRNGSGENLSFSRDDFAFRSLGERPHEGPVWRPRDGGREPALSGAVLAPAESRDGWLTFHVPIESHLDELLWRPEPGVVYGIWLPPQRGSFRSGRALVFGKVTGPGGEPVRGARVVLTPLQVVPAVPGYQTTVGGCTGSPLSTAETETDAEGWYAQVLSPTHVDLMCVDVQVFPGPGGGLTPARAPGTVPPGRIVPMEEPPEVRVDLTLSSEPGE